MSGSLLPWGPDTNCHSGTQTFYVDTGLVPNRGTTTRSGPVTGVRLRKKATLPWLMP